MRQRMQFFCLFAALITAPQLAQGADQGAAGAIQSLGAAAAGTGSAEDECMDALGAAATGSDATQDSDVSSAGDTIGEGLAAARRTGCTSEGTSVGRAIEDGTQDATQAIVGE